MKNKGFLFRVSNPFLKILESKKDKKIQKKRLKKIPKEIKFIEIEAINGSLDDFCKLLNHPGKIGIILGARGSGKSALGMRILENIHSFGKNVYALGFTSENLPKWITVIADINQIPNHSFLLVDEAGIGFSSRSSMSSINKLLTELLLISRHKDISIIFITQNSSNVEINTLRQADYLLLKPSSLLQLDFERKKIKEIYQEVKDNFKKHNEKGVVYVYSDAYTGFIKSELPSFWSDDLSKSFSGLT